MNKIMNKNGRGEKYSYIVMTINGSFNEEEAIWNLIKNNIINLSQILYANFQIGICFAVKIDENNDKIVMILGKEKIEV